MAKAAKKQKYDNQDLTAYYSKIYETIDTNTSEDPYGSYVLQRIKGGQKTVFNKTQSEIRNFDMSFLDVIESVYPAITKIMKDPKKSIRYEEEVVAVEKVKKVNSQTVRHLASHTQLIKEVTKEGDVIPSKVLTTFAEEELAIYENRFIKSLVKRMETFLERRYDVMKVSLESFETQRLNVVNEFLMSGQKVTVNLDIQIKNDLTTDAKTTKEQYNRLLYVRELVQGLKGTEFMRALAKARDVLPPIMKTNIILHNPDFKLCYGLWLYLDRVDGLATNVDVSEKGYRFSSIFEKDINQCMALALTSFIKNREIDDIYMSKNLPSVKAPKVQQNDDIELEMNLEADNKKLEDYQMNELLLSETAKFFEAAMDGMQRTGNTYNESIRVVYRQMLDMLDQIYPKAFGASDDELDSKDLYKQLDYARRKAMILKIVHQQKQMNIARMGKEEKRIEKLIEKLEDKIKVQEAEERERLERKRAREEAARLAAIKKEQEREERRKRLERDAIDKQKEQERKDKEKETKRRRNLEGKIEQQAQTRDALMRKRQYLRDIKEREIAEAKAQEEARLRAIEEARLKAEQEAKEALDKANAALAKEGLSEEDMQYFDGLSDDDLKEFEEYVASLQIVEDDEEQAPLESGDASDDELEAYLDSLSDEELAEFEQMMNDMDDEGNIKPKGIKKHNKPQEEIVEEAELPDDLTDEELEAFAAIPEEELAELEELPESEEQEANEDSESAEESVEIEEPEMDEEAIESEESLDDLTDEELEAFAAIPEEELAELEELPESEEQEANEDFESAEESVEIEEPEMDEEAIESEESLDDLTDEELEAFAAIPEEELAELEELPESEEQEANEDSESAEETVEIEEPEMGEETIESDDLVEETEEPMEKEENPNEMESLMEEDSVETDASEESSAIDEQEVNEDSEEPSEEPEELDDLTVEEQETFASIPEQEVSEDPVESQDEPIEESTEISDLEEPLEPTEEPLDDLTDEELEAFAAIPEEELAELEELPESEEQEANEDSESAEESVEIEEPEMDEEAIESEESLDDLTDEELEAFAAIPEQEVVDTDLADESLAEEYPEFDENGNPIEYEEIEVDEEGNPVESNDDFDEDEFEKYINSLEETDESPSESMNDIEFSDDDLAEFEEFMRQYEEEHGEGSFEEFMKNGEK